MTSCLSPFFNVDIEVHPLELHRNLQLHSSTEFETAVLLLQCSFIIRWVIYFGSDIFTPNELDHHSCDPCFQCPWCIASRLESIVALCRWICVPPIAVQTRQYNIKTHFVIAVSGHQVIKWQQDILVQKHLIYAMTVPSTTRHYILPQAKSLLWSFLSSRLTRKVHF